MNITKHRFDLYVGNGNWYKPKLYQINFIGSSEARRVEIDKFDNMVELLHEYEYNNKILCSHCLPCIALWPNIETERNRNMWQSGIVLFR